MQEDGPAPRIEGGILPTKEGDIAVEPGAEERGRRPNEKREEVLEPPSGMPYTVEEPHPNNIGHRVHGPGLDLINGFFFIDGDAAYRAKDLANAAYQAGLSAQPPVSSPSVVAAGNAMREALRRALERLDPKHDPSTINLVCDSMSAWDALSSPHGQKK